MKELKKIMCLAIVLTSFCVVSQQNMSTYFVNVPQIGSDASFLVLEHNINSSFNTKNVNNSKVSQKFLSISQIGSNNSIGVKKGANDIQLIRQNGKDNYYSFIDYYNTAPTNMNILQQGNANSLQIYGTNSLMEQLKITQRSSYKTIIIKNY